MGQMDKHKETFKEEAYELLAELETSLLELEDFPDDVELVGRVFRAMHTIKGSGAMFGFDDIAEFMHDIENVFERVRDGEIEVTKELISASLSARDQIRTMLDADGSSSIVDKAKNNEILVSFKKLISGHADEKVISKDSAESDSTDLTDESIVYRINFRPSQNIFMNGTNPIFLLNELQELGDCKIIAQVNNIPSLDDIDPEQCYTYWDVILTTGKGMDAIRDVFIFVADDCQIDIKTIEGYSSMDNLKDHEQLGKILIDKGTLSQDGLDKALSSQKRLGEILVDSGTVTDEGIESALAEQSVVRDVRKKRQSLDTSSNIRVPSHKLDHFINLVGEMVILQQRLSQTAVEQKNSELLSIAEDVERLTVDLRDSAFSVRMLPIGTTFSKLKRLVRDLSNELGKEIEMTTDGGETELDKTVIDQLSDPLVHIIRNSIDHGIETPEVREAAGKSRKGIIHLSATHSGSNVLIRIEDNGKGINPEVIRAKAVEKGLITADAVLSEKECFALLFEPGFSTAQEITSVSGRGVGMDVVKQTVDALKGSIDVKSEPEKGTTITVTLPLTLAIIDGLQVEIGGEFFVLPLSAVEECIELTREDALKAKGRKMINVRGDIIPYVCLKEWFFLTGDSEEIEQIVITRAGDRRVGFLVDRVIGEHQTVIKTLGKVYKDAQGVSGATILGDGRVAIIIDIPQVIHAAELEEHALCA